jgi:hypothetical protein
MAPCGKLADLRLSYACDQRWDDMVGDERVRACTGCNRQVFNLSAMTRTEAEAVMTTRGETPCVRFYRRGDGTVMTSDCPTATRPERRRLTVLASSLAAGTALAAASPALAEPPATESSASQAVVPPDATATPRDAIVPEVEVNTYEFEMGMMIASPPPAKVQWSTWGRLGVGVASQEPPVVSSPPQQQDAVTLPPGLVAHRVIQPTVPTSERSSTWEAAAGADLTLAVAGRGKLRVGAWGELRTSSGPVAGAELVIEGLPPHPYDSRIDGSGSLILRAGANAHVVTGALGFGYVGMWPRDGTPWIGWARHVVFARVVASMNFSTVDARDWSALIGLEIEPIGAIHAVLDLVTK